MNSINSSKNPEIVANEYRRIQVGNATNSVTIHWNDDLTLQLNGYVRLNNAEHLRELARVLEKISYDFETRPAQRRLGPATQRDDGRQALLLLQGAQQVVCVWNRGRWQWQVEIDLSLAREDCKDYRYAG